MKTFEIYASDLTKEAQEELCKLLKVDDLDEMNWNIIPITILEFACNYLKEE